MLQSTVKAERAEKQGGKPSQITLSLVCVQDGTVYNRLTSIAQYSAGH